MYVFRVARIALDLLAQTADVYVHGADVAGVLVAPHNVQQVFTAVYFIRVKYQQLQDIKLLCRQVDLLSVDEDAAALAVQLQIPGFHDLGCVP